MVWVVGTGFGLGKARMAIASAWPRRDATRAFSRSSFEPSCCTPELLVAFSGSQAPHAKLGLNLEPPINILNASLDPKP